MIMGAYDARMSRISVVGVPSSAGSYAAGEDQAPGALRSAGLVEALVAAGREVRDDGDLPVQVWRPERDHPFAQNSDQVTACPRELAERLGPLLARGDMVLVLGGNCTTALAVIAALRGMRAGPPGLFYVDRHYDINTRRAPSTAHWTGWAWPMRPRCRAAPMCSPTPSDRGPSLSQTRWRGWESSREWLLTGSGNRRAGWACA